jgi:hypothetical protein
VQGALLAAVHPGDTPAGYNLTFAFPMLMFIIIAGALYLRFRSPHQVPGHVARTSSKWAGGGTGTVNFGEETVLASVEPEPTPEMAAHLAEEVPAEPEAAEPAAAAEPQAAAETQPAAEAGPAGTANDTEDNE